MAAGANGNGNGSNGWSAKNLALLLLLGPATAGAGSWWFTKDAAEMLKGIEVERDADLKELKVQLDRELAEKFAWRDRTRDDHEQRIRRLEERLYGRSSLPPDYER